MNKLNSQTGGNKKETVEHDEVEEPTSLNMNKNDMMAGRSMNRINNWATEAIEDQRLLGNLHDGLVTKHTVHKHQFRDRDKDLEKSNIPFIPKK